MKNTYYCPRGCNVFETDIEDPDCAACGRIMLLDPGPFEEAHEQRELERFAACEPKLLKDERGYFIGFDDHGIKRLSLEYWTTKEAADYALKYHRWTPRDPKSTEWEWGD
jgi:hypothetical protein